MQCSQCSRTMRPYGVKTADAPNTVPQGGRGLCSNCAKKQGQPVDSIDDSPAVLVRAVLRPSTYKAFARHANELHLEVGDLLSRLADRAVGTAPLPAPALTPERPEDDIDARIRHLNGAGLNDTEIAEQLGMSQSNTSMRRRRLGLKSPRTRRPNRKAA